MYSVTVSRACPAQHRLTVPEPGPEGKLHTHDYRAEVELEGESLGEHGYLVDIDEVEAALDTLEARYRDAVLNELPEFEGNPSVERFARCFCERFIEAIDLAHIDRVRVTIWEDDTAAGGYERRV